jgi:hypothetical protein
MFRQRSIRRRCRHRSRDLVGTQTMRAARPPLYGHALTRHAWRHVRAEARAHLTRARSGGPSRNRGRRGRDVARHLVARSTPTTSNGGAAPFCQMTAVMTSLDKPGRSTKVPQVVAAREGVAGSAPGATKDTIAMVTSHRPPWLRAATDPAARTTTICFASASRQIPTARPTTPADVSPPLNGRR